MYWNHHGMYGWGFGLMALTMLIFWGLIIFGVIALVRYLGRSSQHHTTTWPTNQPPERPTPEQLLAERFARGEIDADEYRDRLATLRSAERGPTSG